MAEKENWYDDDSHGPFSNFLTNFDNKSANELTMADDSYNQRACEGVANVATAGAGCGGIAYNGGKKATDSMISGGRAYHDWAQGLSDPDDGVYPYTRFRDE